MTRREKVKKLAYDLINKQLEIVGVGRTFEEFTEEGGRYRDLYYYQKYEISFEQHQQWLDWAVPYVMKVLRCKKSWAMKEVQMIDLSHGLKFKASDIDKFCSLN